MRLPCDGFIFGSVELLRFEFLKLSDRLADACGEFRNMAARVFTKPSQRKDRPIAVLHERRLWGRLFCGLG
jgi:hypothetical protein